MFYYGIIEKGGTAMNDKTFKTGELAKLAGVTIRTLRYYDSIDILNPSKVLENGHRLYDFNDVERLQLILGLKALDFSLVDIKEYLERSEIDLVDILMYQKRLLQRKIDSYKDIGQKIDFIVEHYKEADDNRVTDIFSIYEMMQMVKHNEIAEKYFSDDFQKIFMSDTDHDIHDALNKSIMILAKNMSNISTNDTKFIIDTFNDFIEKGFNEVSEKTIGKTTQMLIEIIESDINNKIKLKEIDLYSWLCANLLYKE